MVRWLRYERETTARCNQQVSFMAEEGAMHCMPRSEAGKHAEWVWAHNAPIGKEEGATRRARLVLLRHYEGCVDLRIVVLSIFSGTHLSRADRAYACYIARRVSFRD